MPLRNTDDRYGLVSIALHWLAAAAIFALLGTSYFLWQHPQGQAHISWVRTHIAIGVAMWLIVAARALWHFIERQPRRLGDAPVLNRVATVVHATMLALVLFQLLSGPVNVWSGGYPVGLYDWWTAPNPMPGKWRAQHDAIGEVHIFVGWTTACLVFLHLCGVAKHVVIDRDASLGRMLGRPPA